MRAFKFKRLLGMGVLEISCRGQQEMWKWLERVAARNMSLMAHSVSAGPLPAVIPAFPMPEIQSGRFFEGAVSPSTRALMAKHLPEVGNWVVGAADAVSEKRFDVLGYGRLFFGDPVQWHLDPISERRVPVVHWSRLDPLDPTFGDSKVIWELNRHQGLVHLAQAFQLTGNESYARVFSHSVREWMEANPPGMGINWTSSLEVALRLIAWCWAIFLLLGSSALSEGLRWRILESLQAHARHIEKYLSRYFSPNTHLTGEALGLFYAGVLFPELERASRWREAGWRILVEQCEKQVLPDGVYFEQSTCYQRYTLEIYLHFLILAARNGIDVPEGVKTRVQRMIDFLICLRQPDGLMPRIGDVDGGSLLPLVSREPGDFQGVFSTAAALFARKDYAWSAGAMAPDTLWLLGERGLRAFEGLRPCAPATKPSRLFGKGGYAVMRTGWGPDAHQLIFDVGPLGCPVSGGHGHADLLSVQCSVFGEPFLVDSGMSSYTVDGEWRDFFRSTQAHSTIVVDGVSQSVQTGPFSWENRPRARLTRWISSETLDVAEAEHDAYRRLPEPVDHRRRVLFVKPHYWVLVDELRGQGEHRIELRFQFASLDLTLDPHLWARARGRKGDGLMIRSFARAPLKAEVVEGDLFPIAGWISPNYGQRLPAPLLIYSARTRLPERFVTLLVPTGKTALPPPLDGRLSKQAKLCAESLAS